MNTIKAIDSIKPDYTNFRITHEKNRYADPPRSSPQASGMKKTVSSNSLVRVTGLLEGAALAWPSV